jgi:hypothetical protein
MPRAPEYETPDFSGKFLHGRRVLDVEFPEKSVEWKMRYRYEGAVFSK